MISPPILNLIHLNFRDDRRQSFMEECNIQNIAYKRWDGVENKSPHIGINAAHKAIVQKAKEDNRPFVIIAEDDIKFSSKNSWRYYLSQTPKEFDLYCGLIYDGKVDKNNRIISTRGMSGTNTLYTIHEKFYDFFLATDNSKHLDRELGKFATLNHYYVCNPMVCYQMGGYSDNLKRELNYDEYLVGKKLYGQ